MILTLAIPPTNHDANLVIIEKVNVDTAALIIAFNFHDFLSNIVLSSFWNIPSDNVLQARTPNFW